MKTLADFKRRLVVGAKLRVTFHMPRLVIRGNVGNTVIPTPPPEERIVAKVQINSVAFDRQHVPDKPPGPQRWSWLDYLDAGHTDWWALCSSLPPERLWDLCQVIGHTYHQGRDHERQRLYRLFAEGGIKRAKIRGQNAYRVIETANGQPLQLA